VADIELEDLSPGTLASASLLLACYMYPAGWSEQQRQECELALERLLYFEGAGFVLAKLAASYGGFISLHWGFSTTKGLPILRVQDLFTLPHYRRQGVGRALLQHAAQLARAQGANRLQLETDQQNTPAQALYQATGFEWLPSKRVYMLFL
jgi:GNAT superfamily N-acetyltransferase